MDRRNTPGEGFEDFEEYKEDLNSAGEGFDEELEDGF